MKILLVEDEPKLASFIKKGLTSEGYDLLIAYDGQMGLALAQQQPFDLIILDVNLPLLNGFELCRRIRADYPHVPVIFLTAFDSLEDKVLGFEAGADDYLVKPFAFQELLLRVRALGRRQQAAEAVRHIISLADLELNLDAKVVTRAGQRIDLTTKEYALLEYLLLNQGRIISRVAIAEHVWDVNFDTNTNLVDVYVSYLRKKLDRGFSPKLIHTVVGMGYVMRAE